MPGRGLVAYAAKLHALINHFHVELRAPNVPFIVGQLGRFAGSPWNEFKTEVDRAHRELPAKIPHTAFVASESWPTKATRPISTPTPTANSAVATPRRISGR